MSKIKSPCIDICKLDKETGICIGCFRTVEEIAKWKKMEDDEKLDVLGKLKDRETLLKPK